MLYADCLSLDAVTQCEVTATLKTVVSGIANVQFEGNVAGTVGGIASEIQLKAKYHFDIEVVTNPPGWEWRFAKNARSDMPSLSFETLTKVAMTSDPDG